MANIEWQNFHLILLGLAIKFGIACLIVCAGWLIAKTVRKVIFKLFSRIHLDKTLNHFLSNLIHTLILIITGITALNMLGVQTTSLVAILGAIGLAVALAFKDSLSNLAAGLLIIIYKPFKLDDYIEVEGKAGTVSDINIFSTKLITSTNEALYIPNAKLTENYLTNFTCQPLRKIQLPVRISYAEDVIKIKSLLSEMLMTESKILRMPAHEIVINDLSESYLTLSLRAWVQQADYWPALYSLQEKIKALFDENQIAFPYPQRQVHIAKNDLIG